MKNFDFIIIGGGTSGTVTAAKLVKNGHSVLLYLTSQMARLNSRAPLGQASNPEIRAPYGISMCKASTPHFHSS